MQRKKLMLGIAILASTGTVQQATAVDVGSLAIGGLLGTASGWVAAEAEKNFADRQTGNVPITGRVLSWLAESGLRNLLVGFITWSRIKGDVNTVIDAANSGNDAKATDAGIYAFSRMANAPDMFIAAMVASWASYLVNLKLQRDKLEQRECEQTEKESGQQEEKAAIS